MSSDISEAILDPRTDNTSPMSGETRSDNNAADAAATSAKSDATNSNANSTAGNADGAPKSPVTVIVRGESVGDKDAKSPSKDAQNKPKASNKPVSEAKVKQQSRLPALDDDNDVGVQKEQVVTRDGKADLNFTGTLLASAAPLSAPKGEWQEYRIYETNGGKHVFSKLSRKIFQEDQDEGEAEIFDPAPTSATTQLLRSARDLVHSKEKTWQDAAVDFFGYDPLAKALYRKFGNQFEEKIS
jgi:hypothetical protein